ncbi:HIT family protein [Oligoflexaceae bacterium]|nr:HIT family protein [Oligoflexaceae bacterium]
MVSCVTCDKHQVNTAELVLSAEYFKVFHYPQENGSDPAKAYLLVEASRHVESFSELTASESSELGLLISRLSAVIESEFSAEHVYVFRIGDMVRHLHFHLVPRYSGTPQEFYGDKIRSYHDGLTADRAMMADVIEKIKIAFERLSKDV